jgi:nicotinate-nucleotide adenylyltransferase
VAFEFLHRGAADPARVILFPGTWNPPTVAHMEIARVARRQADEVIWVLPRTLPHKDFEGASFEDRCRMLEALAHADTGFSAAVSSGGLYAEIAREAAAALPANAEIAFALGRDAAERIASWDYGEPGVFDAFIRRHRLLVAARNGDYLAAEEHRHRVGALPMDACWDEVSSSEVRRRIAAGEEWRDLVPPEIAGIVQNIY